MCKAEHGYKRLCKEGKTLRYRKHSAKGKTHKGGSNAGKKKFNLSV